MCGHSDDMFLDALEGMGVGNLRMDLCHDGRLLIGRRFRFGRGVCHPTRDCLIGLVFGLVVRVWVCVCGCEFDFSLREVL